MFLIIASAVYLLIHYFVFRNIAVGLNLSPFAKNFLKILFLAGILLFPIGEFLSHKGYFSAHVLIYLGSVWLGIISIAVTIFFLNDILLLFFKGPGFRYYSTICSLVILALTCGYSLYNVSIVPRVREINISVKKILPKSGKFTIVQLSDLHLGVLTSPKWLKNVVDNVNGLNPDIIVITGDLIDGDILAYDEFPALLKQLKPKYGIFAITGNHEFYAGIDKFLAIADKVGIQVLRNKNYTIDNLICLAGVDDPQGKRFGGPGSDLNLALKDCNKKIPVILLNHRPQNFNKAVEMGADLQLSGHTHAGQIPPMDFLVLVAYKYAFGLHTYQDKFIYITTGTGTWGPPMRLFSRSEIVKITLANSN